MKYHRFVAAVPAVSLVSLPGLANVDSYLVSDATDPECTVENAAKGAATKATIGVGNQCDAVETARDVTGVSGKVDDAKAAISPKPSKNIKI